MTLESLLASHSYGGRYSLKVTIISKQTEQSGTSCDVSQLIKAQKFLADEENKCSQTAFPDYLSIMQTSVNLF
jgi:hypothetical protein